MQFAKINLSILESDASPEALNLRLGCNAKIFKHPSANGRRCKIKFQTILSKTF
jgi:hypothetical protein